MDRFDWQKGGLGRRRFNFWPLLGNPSKSARAPFWKDLMVRRSANRLSVGGAEGQGRSHGEVTQPQFLFRDKATPNCQKRMKLCKHSSVKDTDIRPTELLALIRFDVKYMGV